MRRYFYLVVIVVISFVISSCSAPSTSSSEQPIQNTASSDQPMQTTASIEESVPREMPLVMKLALGTFKLDETDSPITSEQAGKFLPLWKAVRSLSQSETAAAEETQALIKQIQDSMTSEQMKAINDMGLTFQDMRSIAEEMGLDFGSGRIADMNPEMRATIEARRQSGQGPPGGGGLGFFMGGPGGNPEEGFSPEMRQTAIAQRGGGSNRIGVGLPSALLDAIIKFLEAKVVG